MKKSNLTTGILFAAFGGILFLAAVLAKGKLSALLTGFSFAYLSCGVVTIGKYVYWSLPENRERYEEKLAREKIEFHDELKITLRDKSGRYAYILGLITVSLSIVVFSALEALEILEARMILIFLSAYLVFQYVAGILIFKFLLKKILT